MLILLGGRARDLEAERAQSQQETAHRCTVHPVDGIATVSIDGQMHDLPCCECGKVLWRGRWSSLAEIGAVAG